MAHWKHAATRCAVEGCERTRVKGRTTCARIGHYERGVSLYGLKPGAARLTENASSHAPYLMSDVEHTTCN
jgi:hypothetical protein